jgi:hypothetical protein
METTAKKENLQVGFLIQFEAKEGKAAEVARAFSNAKPIIDKETGTIVWFAFRTSDTGFGLFDAFYTEEARNAHWEVGSKGLDKLSPSIDNDSFVVKKVDIIEAKFNRG